MEDTSREIVSRIIATPEGEMNWVQLLSQLEYVGCRKILKSVPFHRVSAEVLRHISEEASHALLLKEAVEASGIEVPSWEESPWCVRGWHYFQQVDHQACELVADKGLHYPLVSFVIEQRVLWLYPCYLRMTTNERVRRALKVILAQEKRHAEQFNHLPLSTECQAEAVRIEAAQWDKLMASLAELLPASGSEPGRETPGLRAPGATV